MNGKYPAKTRLHLAALATVGLVFAGSLIPRGATADFGHLSQQQRIQQHKSRFQLMLEQVQESARQRAAAARTTSATPVDPSMPVGLGDWTESMRLDPVTVTDPVTRDLESESTRRLRAKQAHDRDQRRILDHRQQRRALIAGPRTAGPSGAASFAAKRREVVRFQSQTQRLSLQRKLRR